MRQLQLVSSAPNRSRSQEGHSMPSENQQANDQQTTQSAHQHPTKGSEHAVQSSGPKGDNPATAGPGPTNIRSGNPENRLGRINPSAPEDANTTPGTSSEK